MKRKSAIPLAYVVIAGLLLCSSSIVPLARIASASGEGKRVGIYLATAQTGWPYPWSSASDFMSTYIGQGNLFTTILLYTQSDGSSDPPEFQRVVQIAAAADAVPNFKLVVDFGFNLLSSSDWAAVQSTISQLAQHPSVGWVGIEGEHTTYDSSGCEFGGNCQTIGQAWNDGQISQSQLQAYYSQFDTMTSNAGLSVAHYYVTFGGSSWADAQQSIYVAQWPDCGPGSDVSDCSQVDTKTSEIQGGTTSNFIGISGGLATNGADYWNPTVSGTSNLDDIISTYINVAEQQPANTRQLILFEIGGYGNTADTGRSIFQTDLANAMAKYSDFLYPTGSPLTTSSTSSSASTTSSTPSAPTTTTSSTTTTSTSGVTTTSTSSVVTSTTSTQTSTTVAGSACSSGCGNLALDGSNIATAAGVSSLTITLTTSHSPDVIILAIAHDNAVDSVSSGYPRDTAGLTWTKRADNTGDSGRGSTLWYYYAIATGTLSSDTIAVSFSGSDNTELEVFGISGANTGSPFDSNSGLPAVHSDNTGVQNPTVSISTSNANDMLLGIVALKSTGTYSVSAGSGYTLIGQGKNSGSSSLLIGEDYEVVSSTQNNVPVSFSGSKAASDDYLIADAIKASSGSSTVSSTSCTICLVQGPYRGTAQVAGGSLRITMGSTPTSGNVIILSFTAGADDNNPYISGISETGVTWYKAGAYSADADTEIWYGLVGSGASASIAVTIAGGTGGDYNEIGDAVEWSGLNALGPLDRVSSGAADHSTSLGTGTTATTSQASELWVGAAGGFDQGSLVDYTLSSPTNGFTLLDGTSLSGSGIGGSLGYLYKVVSSTGTASTGVTAANPYYWGGIIATFKAASGGTGGT